GFMSVLASYYIQALRVDLVGLGLAVFLGITVVEMHHMAVLTDEKEYAPETNRNARLLLKIHRAAAYAIGLMLLISRLVYRSVTIGRAIMASHLACLLVRYLELARTNP